MLSCGLYPRKPSLTMVEIKKTAQNHAVLGCVGVSCESGFTNHCAILATNARSIFSRLG